MPVVERLLSGDTRLLQAVAVIFAAIITLVGSVCGRFLYEWWQQQRTRQEVRQLLLAELATLSELDIGVNDHRRAEFVEEEVQIVHNHISTATFEALGADIGCLTSTEIETVREYYSVAEVASRKLEVIRKTNGDTTALRASFADRTLPQLRDRRQAAEQALSAQLSCTTDIPSTNHDCI